MRRNCATMVERPEIRGEGLLESALARPKYPAAYAKADVAEIGAAYAYGLTRNHPFVDGNKRTALIVCETFSIRNGHRLEASDAELVVLFEELAAGRLTEHELADWLSERVVRA